MTNLQRDINILRQLEHSFAVFGRIKEVLENVQSLEKKETEAKDKLRTITTKIEESAERFETASRKLNAIKENLKGEKEIANRAVREEKDRMIKKYDIRLYEKESEIEKAEQYCTNKMAQAKDLDRLQKTLQKKVDDLKRILGGTSSLVK